MTTESPGRARADHLPRDGRSGERHPVKACASILGIAVLVIGIPAALVTFVGNPLPTTMPDRSWLTADVTTGTVIKVFAAIVWLVWAHFVVCLVAEWHAMRHGRVPAAVFFGGGPQAVARKLIATALLLTGAASIGHGITGTAGAAPATASSMVTQTAPLVPAVHHDRVDPAEASDAAHARYRVGGHDRGTTDDSTPAKTGSAVKYYTVQPHHGRHYDTLWDIAERHLGDPLRYKEIFALNKDRVQADGRRLVDADLIQAGWRLRLPADATGPGVHTVERHSATPEGRADPAADTPPAVTMPTFERTVQQSAHQDGDTSRGLFDRHATEFGGALVLAGVLLALTGRRGPHGEPAESDVELRLAANVHRASFIDRALRILGESRRAQNLLMPDVAVAYADDDQLILHLVGGAEAPTAPWVAADDGASWKVRRTDLGEITSTAPAPYPALVPVARSHGFDVLVDLEYATGPVSFAGDDRVAREVVMSCAADVLTHAWSDHVEVTAVGFADGIDMLDSDRLTRSDDVDTALETIAGRLGRADRLVEKLGVSGILEGRARTRNRDLAPQILLLSAAPTASQIQRIAGLQREGRSPLTVLALGDVVAARWRFTVDSDGAIDLGVLGVEGTANRWTVEATTRIAELMREAGGRAQSAAEQIAVATPAQVVDGAAARGVAHADRGPAPRDAVVQVRLLGPVRVQAPGPLASAHEDVLTETVVMAALHPQGLHESVLASSLWPRGVEEDVVSAVIGEAAEWLGRGPDGARLRLGEDGLWHLTDDVFVDHAELVAAAACGDDERLVDCLTRVTGEVFSGTPVGRYTWLAFLRGARDARATLTTFARTRAAAFVRRNQRDRAVEALEQGLIGVPTAQILWRERLKLITPGDPDGVGACVQRMSSALRGQRLEPETSSVVEHLEPDWDRDALG